MKAKRTQKFANLIYQDPWYSRLAKKLTEKDLLKIDGFIAENGDLPIAEWEFKLNRLFLDQIEKPKNWALIMEFLMISGKVA